MPCNLLSVEGSCVSAGSGATEWVQWLERVSMNAAQIECYLMNAYIAIM